MHVAVCVAGQARTFWNDVVYKSLLHNLWALQKQHLIPDLFLAFAAEDQNSSASNPDVLLALRPRDIRFDRPSDCHGSDFRFCLQWLALSLCLSMIKKAEQDLKLTYAWTLRLRPDCVWFSHFPSMHSLKEGHIHARLLCPGSSLISARQLRWGQGRSIEGQCWAVLGEPSHHVCPCNLWGCPAEELIIDDMAAIVPRELLDAYFLIVKPSEGFANRRSHGPEFYLTSSLHAHGAKVSPTSFEFAIVRLDGRMDHVNPNEMSSATSMTCDVRLLLPTKYRELCRPSYVNRFCDDASRAVLSDSANTGDSNRLIAALRIWISEHWSSIQDADHFDEEHLIAVISHFLHIFCTDVIAELLMKILDSRGGQRAHALIYFIADGFRKRKQDLFVTSDEWEAWLLGVRAMCWDVAAFNDPDARSLDVRGVIEGDLLTDA